MPANQMSSAHDRVGSRPGSAVRRAPVCGHRVEAPPHRQPDRAVSSQNRWPNEAADAVRPVVGFGAVLVDERQRRCADQRLRTRRPASSRTSVNTLSTVGAGGDRRRRDRVDEEVRADVDAAAGRFALQLHHRLDHARGGLAVVGAAHDDVVVGARPARSDARRDRRSDTARSRTRARPPDASIAAAASAGLAEAEVSALARAQPVLPEAILLRDRRRTASRAWRGTRAATAGPAAAGARSRRRPPAPARRSDTTLSRMGTNRMRTFYHGRARRRARAMPQPRAQTG